MASVTLDKTFFGRKVLITGGLGFIGSNLARALVEQGAHVVLVDSLVPE
jgi:UDP-glucose 4-epimerase